jgi:hypothetical protein
MGPQILSNFIVENWNKARSLLVKDLCSSGYADSWNGYESRVELRQRIPRRIVVCEVG